jgi:hypothetical protein
MVNRPLWVLRLNGKPRSGGQTRVGILTIRQHPQHKSTQINKSSWIAKDTHNSTRSQRQHIEKVVHVDGIVVFYHMNIGKLNAK